MTFPDPVANALCLELVNTVNNWHEPRADVLDAASTAVAWTELLAAPIAVEPDAASLARARALRGHVRDLFAAIARSSEPDPGDLAAVGKAYAAGVRRARLEPDGATYALRWPPDGGLDDLVAQAAASALELLTDGPLERVGECPSCGWLFLDTSRNGRRRWCSMNTCGARVKARRHYARR